MKESANLKPCPFCGGNPFIFSITQYFGDRATFAVVCEKCNASSKSKSKEEYAINAWNRRFNNEGDKITCKECKHLMFSDCYGECNKSLRIVNPDDTCEYAERKEQNNEQENDSV